MEMIATASVGYMVNLCLLHWGERLTEGKYGGYA